ncbi:hypothetical protein VaNZ11_006520, partial [Volvox africanus]
MADESHREDEPANDDRNEKNDEKKCRPTARSTRQIASSRLMLSEAVNGVDSDGVRARALAFGTKAVAVSSNKQLTSKFRGVCWNKKNKRWQAAINSSGKYLYLGSYDTEAEAAAVFDKAAVRIRGVKARLNFCCSDYVEANGKIRDDPAIEALLNDAVNPAKPRRQRGFGAAAAAATVAVAAAATTITTTTTTGGTAPPGAAPPPSQPQPPSARVHVCPRVSQTPLGSTTGCDTSQGLATRAARPISGRRRRRDADSGDEAWSGQRPARTRRPPGNRQAANGCHDSSAATASSTTMTSRQSMSGSEEAGDDGDDGGAVNGGGNAGHSDRYGPTGGSGGGGGAAAARRSYGLDEEGGPKPSEAAATAGAAAFMGAVTAAAGLEMGLVGSRGLQDMDLTLEQLGQLGHWGLGPNLHNVHGGSAGPKNLYVLQPLDQLSIAQKLAAGAGAAAATTGGDSLQPDPHRAAAAMAAAAQLQAVRRAAGGLGALSSSSTGLHLQDQHHPLPHHHHHHHHHHQHQHQHQQAKLAAAATDTRAMGLEAAAAAAHQLRMREESLAGELEMLMNGGYGRGNSGELVSDLTALHGHPFAAAAAGGLPLHGLSLRLNTGGEDSPQALSGLRNLAHGARAAGGGLGLGLGWGQGSREGEGSGISSGLWEQLGLEDASHGTLYALQKLG